MKPPKLGPTFQWFNLTQFMGSVNDNYFQQILIFALRDGMGWDIYDVLMISGIVFALPYLLFLPAAGIVADRYSKQRITLIAKIVELTAMVLGLIGFYCIHVGQRSGMDVLLFVALILLCANGAFFNPTKYGILREIVDRKNLSKANGVVQACTYIAIVFGFLVAAGVSKLTTQNFFVLGLISVVVAIVGLFSATRVPYTKPAGTTERFSWLFFQDVWGTLRSIRHQRYLLAAVLASAFFLMIAAFVKGYILPFGEEVHGWSLEKSTLVFLAAAGGIGAGSILAGMLSKNGIEFGIVPLGALMISFGALLLGIWPVNLFVVIVYLAIIGIGAGLFIVPLEVFMQDQSPPEQVGQVLAAGTWMGFVGIVIAFISMKVMDSIGIDPKMGFRVISGFTAIVTAIAMWKLPDFFTRFVFLILTRTVYRIRTMGESNVPATGPALLVSNHVSWADALVLMATQQRRVRFLMSKKILNRAPRLRWLARLLKVIPVQSGDGREGIQQSLEAAKQALEEGYIVCIFAEGSVSRTGNMASFKSGFERIAQATGVPIIPVYIGGAWGSITSYAHGKLFSRWPIKLPYPITIVFGEEMPSDSTGFEVRQRVTELSTLYFEDKKPRRRPIGFEVVRRLRSAKRYTLNDSMRKEKLSGRKTLIGGLVFRQALRRELEANEKRVGVLVPSSVPGVLVNIALILDRREAINLNPTAGVEALQSALDQTGLHTLITSRKVLEKFPNIPLPAKVVYLEDVAKGIGTPQKVLAAIQAYMVPARLLTSCKGFHADEVASILFSSGSTGIPKGVMLSHHNILSNIESFKIMYTVKDDDNLCSALPLFHSFGYTIGMWAPILMDLPTSYHISPLDSKGVAAVVKQNKSTLMVATPTFLKMYLKAIKTEDLASLRLCLVGAEKMQTDLADKFEKKFGSRPFEGYGTTECSPCVAVNIPNQNIDGVRQRGTLEGSVGQPLPGIAARIVDPDTGEELKSGESGMLLVKGPNIMLGYLGMPERTAEVLKDGWYTTGDIGFLSSDGFITLTGRLSRFSKIAGEMVPHLRIEEVLQKLVETDEAVLAVTGVPDSKRGEKLVVLHTDAVDPEDLKAGLASCDLPNLWKPKVFAQVEELPILATGKLNLKLLQQIAKEVTDSG